MTNRGRMIDLATDARTSPTSRMWEAMQAVQLNQVPFVGNQSVEALLNRAGELTGHEAAILLPSCTMANLIAIMVHAQRGDQVILEESSHIAWSEGWGLASIAGVYPRLIRGIRGVISTTDLLAAIHESKFSHCPRTRLVCLENTHNASGGTVLTVENTNQICNAMTERGINVHLDGARIFNAAAAINVPVRCLTEMFHSVAINLNKGLSGLEGALLCGSASFIQQASRIAKALGGGSQHKADMIAAAGQIALDEMLDVAIEDNRKAYLFAEAARRIPGISIDMESVQTNIVMLDVSGIGLDANEALRRLMLRGVAAYVYDLYSLRFVFHRHIQLEEIDFAIEQLQGIGTDS